MGWTVETLNEAVDDEIEALPVTIQAGLVRVMEMVENVGLHNIHRPHSRHIEGKIWELRAKAPEGYGRALYVAATGKRVVILHAFVKKGGKTPKGSLEIARDRAKEV